MNRSRSSPNTREEVLTENGVQFVYVCLVMEVNEGVVLPASCLIWLSISDCSPRFPGYRHILFLLSVKSNRCKNLCSVSALLEPEERSGRRELRGFWFRSKKF